MRWIALVTVIITVLLGPIAAGAQESGEDSPRWFTWAEESC
jgi:hypothetical protein